MQPPRVAVALAALAALCLHGADALSKEAAAAGAAPPYAVSMEPMVPYSQRDPLYHAGRPRSTQRRHAVLPPPAPARGLHAGHVGHGALLAGLPVRGAKNRRDAGPYGPPPPPQQHYDEYGPPQEHHEYPEPIIEIIIKESNETLPAPPPPPVLPPKKPTREPVHVFYVKYKQTGTGEYGKDGNSGVVFDDPIPALTPAPPPEEEEEEQQHHHHQHTELEEVTPAPPRQTTTLRAIIHPDSELAHAAQGSEGKLRVTFGGPHEDEGSAHAPRSQYGASDKHDKQDGHEEGESAQQPAVAFPVRFPADRDADADSHQIKRSQLQPAPHLQQTGAPGQGPPGAPQQAFQQQQHFQQGRQHFQPAEFPPYRGQNQFGPPPPPPPPGPLRGQPPQQHQQHQQHQKPAFLRPQSSLEALQNPRYPQFQQPQQPPPLPPQPQQLPQQGPFQEPFRPRLPGPGEKPQRPPFAQQQHDNFRPNYFPQPQPQQQPQPGPAPTPSRPGGFGGQHAPHLQHAQHSSSRPAFQHPPPPPPPPAPAAFPPFPQPQQPQQPPPPPHQVVRDRHNQQALLQQQQQQQALLRHQQQQEHIRPHHHHHQPQQQQFTPQHGQFSAPQHQQFNPQPSQPQPSFAPQHQQQPNHQQQQLYRPQHEQQLKQQALIHQQQQFIPSHAAQAHRHQQAQPQQQQQRENVLGTDIIKSIPQSEEHVLLNNGQGAQSAQGGHGGHFSQPHPQHTQQQQQQQQQQHPQLNVQVLNNDQDGPRVTFASSTSSYTPEFVTPSPKPQASFSLTPSTTTANPPQRPTQRPTPTPTTTTTEEPTAATPEAPKIDLSKKLAQLPDEVPDDIREQLISSGILGNADIQILDYDKIGDTSISDLPAHALENFYANGGGSQAAASEHRPVVVAPPPRVQVRGPVVDAEPSASEFDEVVQEPAPAPQASNVEMKVVRYDPATAEGQQVADQYLNKEAAVLNDPVVLNDNRYNRYLPLKISGAAFPLPDAPLLRGRNVTSVVVLAPVDYDFLQAADGAAAADPDAGRVGRAVEVHGVRFVAGDALKKLVRSPSLDNYRLWLQQERQKPLAKQSVILLVTSPTESGDGPADAPARDKEIFMYDASSDEVSRLSGELSSSFVEVAESNALSQDLENVDVADDAAAAEAEAQASSRQEVRVPAPAGFLQRRSDDDMEVAASDPVSALFHASPSAAETPRVAISSGYARTSLAS